MDQKIIKMREAVNSLFSHNHLKLNITDYNIDQTAYLVDSMSDDAYRQEKMMLLDQIKFAKHLSQKRNLLNHGDFEGSNWSGKNGWKRNNYVVVESDHPIFKGGAGEKNAILV
ncbi:hypothetical protein CN271_32710, partial [Bacillus cereus]|uniref:hypothetical protein n=1 Tax=Bacillus cereus TaxID=1396 RepID=UPI000BEE7B84